MTSRMKISLVVTSEPPKRAEKPAMQEPSIEEEVKHCLEMIESSHDSGVEFQAIRGLYHRLCKMKQNDRIRNLRKMIKPVLSKYGYHAE